MEKNRSKEFTEKDHVDVDQQWEIDFWTDRWGITQSELLTAVKETKSTDVETLEKYLIDKKTSS